MAPFSKQTLIFIALVTVLHAGISAAFYTLSKVAGRNFVVPNVTSRSLFGNRTNLGELARKNTGVRVNEGTEHFHEDAKTVVVPGKGQEILRRIRTGKKNIKRHHTKDSSINIANHLGDAPYVTFIPGGAAMPFNMPTLKQSLHFPGPVLKNDTPIILSIYSSYSRFLQCLWNCSGSLEDLVLNSPENINYIFVPTGQNALQDALWMKGRFDKVLNQLVFGRNVSRDRAATFAEQLHFATVPIDELGNWIPQVLSQWACLDHNCGFDQAVFNSSDIYASRKGPLVLNRLDARYDWLQSAASVLGGAALEAVYFADSCSNSSRANFTGKVVMVTQENCSYAMQVLHAQERGALGLVLLERDGHVTDMTCAGKDCLLDLHIPVSSVSYDEALLRTSGVSVTFQNSPSSNFFMAIDHHATLQEVGWFLYPTMHFLAWQAQWFNYKAGLETNLTKATYVINIFNATVMQGAAGVSRTLSLPSFAELAKYDTMELDMALGCPGSNDRDCPHWDHTISLKICGDVVCDLELGRWISSFRRRIGRWLTDVTALLPLLSGPVAGKATTFTMKTAAWAMPWKPSLNLRFSGRRKSGDLYPSRVLPLYNSDGYTFDSKYNSLFKPINFTVPEKCQKVEIVAVITGHGSDENGCGEFCVTSHTFSVNGKNHSITFSTAGSPLGCADEVPSGSEPNEHGTWLYGRDGWCDGQNVKPWVFDVTHDVTTVARSLNYVQYQGYFNGTDPNPKKHPGVMIFSSYLVFYSVL